eukprot:151508-Chlamydomonas_euryale.AAC.1
MADVGFGSAHNTAGGCGGKGVGLAAMGLPNYARTTPPIPATTRSHTLLPQPALCPPPLTNHFSSPSTHARTVSYRPLPSHSHFPLHPVKL